MRLFSLFKCLEKIFFPYHCIMCLEKSDQERDLCSHCQKNLMLLTPVCSQCGIRLPKEHQKCGQCLQASPYFDKTEIGFEYKTTIAHWLRQFKFHKKGLYARILSEIFAEKLLQHYGQSAEQKPQFLIPIPLHWTRLMRRGFNQSHTIAYYLSKALEIPILKSRTIVRIKITKRQSTLNKNKRQNNIKNAFYLNNMQGLQHVAIIDDVMTTGNTVNELAHLLKKSGIPYVSVWTLTRAEK